MPVFEQTRRWLEKARAWDCAECQAREIS